MNIQACGSNGYDEAPPSLAVLWCSRVYIQRAMLATCAALIVGFAEIILYMIWDSRRSPKKSGHAPLMISTKEKLLEDKVNTVDVTATSSSTDDPHTALRQRLTQSASTPHESLPQ